MATINQLREKVVDGIIQAIQGNESALSNLGEGISVNEINNIVTQGMVQQQVDPEGPGGSNMVMYEQDFGSVQGYGNQIEEDIVDSIVNTCCSGYGMDGTMMCNEPINMLTFTGTYTPLDGDGDPWQGVIQFNECPGAGGQGAVCINQTALSEQHNIWPAAKIPCRPVVKGAELKSFFL